MEKLYSLIYAKLSNIIWQVFKYIFGKYHLGHESDEKI
jgi:hypothetical protein